MQDGRSQKRLRLLADLLEECHTRNLSASSPNLETALRAGLRALALSYSTERQYVQTLLTFLNMERRNPGKRVDLSEGVVRLIDSNGKSQSQPPVAAERQSQPQPSA